jgi:hypothetical protein
LAKGLDEHNGSRCAGGRAERRDALISGIRGDGPSRSTAEKNVKISEMIMEINELGMEVVTYFEK